MAVDIFLAGDGATGHREGCSGLERPLTRFKLERTCEQKKPYLAKCISWHLHPQSLSERATQTFFSCCIAVTNASPTTVSLPAFISLYLSFSVCRSYIFPSHLFEIWSAPTTQNYCGDRYATALLRSWGGSYFAFSTSTRCEFDNVKV